MNTDTGFFERDEERVEGWMQRLRVGEIVKIKGEELKVVGFSDRTVTLRLESAEDRFTSERAAGTTLEDLRTANRHERRAAAKKQGGG